MKNKRMKYDSLATVCLLLLALLPASCIKDDYAAKEKATVRVTFTTRADGGTTVVSSGLAENEQMHTLRVIVAKSGKILYNVMYNTFDINEETGQKYKTITFSELVTEDEADRTFDFYAIANEEGIAGWPTQITSVGDLPVNITLSTSSDLIPQTAKQSITVNIPQDGGGIQEETMQLEFVVAKVRLTIENTSAETQTVSGISLSGVDMTSTPLFAGSLSGVKNGSVSLDEMTIPAESNGTPGKSTVYAYFYENTGGEYKLDATWNGSQTLSFGSGTKYNIGSIPRGTELDINVTLSVNTDPVIDILVVPWEEKSMGVTFD